MLGTTDYVSPEQALGHVVSGQSDLYSLGIVLFEMLTGDVPFKGENQVAVAMKHVREDLPDVQVRRPEVSAALAAVLDRATAKELDRRYPDAATLIADLEDVLAIETSRSGQVTGEATAVLRSLPENTRRRLPLRTRRSTKAIVALVVVIAAIAVVVTVVLGLARPSAAPASARRSRRRPGCRRSRSASARRATSTRSATRPSTPTRRARSSTATRSRRGRPRATRAATLQKDGVGIIIDASPGVAARQLELRTPTTGFEATVYVAADATPGTAPPDGWTAVSATRDGRARREKFDLDTAGQRFRRYLVWITKLPQGEQRAEISEILLYR